MRNGLSRLLFYALILLAVSCDLSVGDKNRNKDNGFVVVKNIDKFVDVVLDKEGGVYVRSKVSDQCERGKYYYNSSVVLGDTLTKDIVEVSLRSRIDVNSLKLVKINERFYRLEDIKYIYDLGLTMCESHMVVDLK